MNPGMGNLIDRSPHVRQRKHRDLPRSHLDPRVRNLHDHGLLQNLRPFQMGNWVGMGEAVQEVALVWVLLA